MFPRIGRLARSQRSHRVDASGRTVVVVVVVVIVVASTSAASSNSSSSSSSGSGSGSSRRRRRRRRRRRSTSPRRRKKISSSLGELHSSEVSLLLCFPGSFVWRALNALFEWMPVGAQ